MKLVVAIIRPEQLTAVQGALAKRGLVHLTVTKAFGGGHEDGPSYIYRGVTVQEHWLPRLKLEIAVDDLGAAAAVDAIRHAAHTGHVGDGLIWVVPLEQVVPIGTPKEAHWGTERQAPSSAPCGRHRLGTLNRLP